MAIYVFELCGSSPAILQDFSIDPADYSGSTPVLYSSLSGGTCWTFTNVIGTGTPLIPDAGPFSDCSECATFATTPTPTISPTQTPTPTNTQTPTQTPTNTITPTPSTTPIICGSGVTTGTFHFYTDCCGYLVTGSTSGTIVIFDYTKAYNGVTKLSVPATTVCPTPTPTPTTTQTPTVTPTITPTPSTTPIICGSGTTIGPGGHYYTDCCGNKVEGSDIGTTIIFDYTQPSLNVDKLNSPATTVCPTPTPTPTSSPVVRLKNDCEVVTIFDMNIESYPIVFPSNSISSDGILSVIVTGGTSPYSFYWAGGERTQTLVGVPEGNYEVTVVDYYGDYTATTIFDLFAPSATPTPTITPTPTTTPAPLYPNLCLIYVGSNVSYGPIQFNLNGTYNDKPTWSGVYNSIQLDIQWSTQNSRWEIPEWSFTSGIPVSVNSSNVPDSAWSMAGGQQAQLSMTQGNCPSYLPLMSVPTTQNQTCPENLNGSITLMTNYGVPPYEYSINGGLTYQSSNVFQGLGASTYTVITRDSATPTNNTLSSTVVLTSLNQTTNYTIGIVVDDIVNLGTGNQLANWRVEVNPPLPIGKTMSFTIVANISNNYYSPGFGTISESTVVKKNNVTLGMSSEMTSGPVISPSEGCSPYTKTSTTISREYFVQSYGYNDVITGSSLSELVITDAQIGPNSCVTKLEQSILVNTISPTIIGGICDTVTNNPQPQGIDNNTLSVNNIE
jgi:hypothetical protein